jgi:hypothetical protein
MDLIESNVRHSLEKKLDIFELLVSSFFNTVCMIHNISRSINKSCLITMTWFVINIPVEREDVFSLQGMLQVDYLKNLLHLPCVLWVGVSIDVRAFSVSFNISVNITLKLPLSTYNTLIVLRNTFD